MKKIGIITINDNDNYGNRLQNYATQEVIKKFDFDPITIKNNTRTNNKEPVYIVVLKVIKNVLENCKRKFDDIIYKNTKRRRCFLEFNKNINFSKKTYIPYTIKEKAYEYFIAGSDQVWKPTYGRMRDLDLLNFTSDDKKIAFSASFGISELPKESETFFESRAKNFKAISVRENAGRNIAEKLLLRKDIEVLIDPTMMLTNEDWNNVEKKPENLRGSKYILNYFLGTLSEERKKEIERIAEENNCEIINILDKKSPFYQTGPSEFLYLEKNAFLICTDSFHSCVFAILYNVPFIVFKREDARVNMNSRLETLLNKFELEERYYKNKISDELLKCDYTNAYKILNKEREKVNQFLLKAFEKNNNEKK